MSPTAVPAGAGFASERERPLLIAADRVVSPEARSHDESRDREPKAVLVRDGRIAAVGPLSALEGAGPDADRLDLPGCTLTPGLTDAHIHLVEWALARREADLSAAATAEEAASLVARHAAGAAGGWIRGRGWNANRWGGFPTRDVLDRVLPDRPVALQSHDMHALWANGEALVRAGIGRDSPDPDGGRIVRYADGEPTGVLLENAAALVARVAPAPTVAEIEAAVVDAQAELHRLGITGVHAFPAIHVEEPESFSFLESLLGRDLLRVRVLQHLPLGSLDDALRAGVHSGAGGDWIRVGAVKMFLDGALGSRTAWLREPYEGSDDVGISVLPPADFREAVRRAARGGIATTVHAIGDAAVCLALDVLAAHPPPSAVPHRIEHLQLCPPERFGDAARTGIVASMQPSHLMTDWRPATRHWGADRCRGAFAVRALADHRTVLAFGSDAPVEPVDPRLGLLAAVTRQDRGGEPAGGWHAEQRIGVAEALRAYTAGPAYAAGRAGELGTIAPGARADIVAWDLDPLTAGPDIAAMRCIATIVAGRLTWRREPETEHALGEV